MRIKCVAFDCFGTLFDPSPLSRDQIKEYVDHVRADKFTKFNFPKAWWNLKAFDDVALGVQIIRNTGIKPITLSNGSRPLLRHLLDTNKVPIQWVTDLVYHQAYKPNNLDAYRAVEKDLGYKPGETLMVTANKTFGDIESAAKIGMPAKLIRVPDCPDVPSLALWIENYNASQES